MKYLFSLSLLVILLSCNSNTAQTSDKETSYKNLEFKDDASGSSLAYKEGQPFTGTALSNYPTGEKYMSQEYVDGKKEGQWILFYKNGQMQKRGSTKNGKEQGKANEWYENGQMKYDQNYVDGKKDGKWLSWYESGVKWTSRDFEMDVLNGKILVWDTLEQLAKEYTYQNGDLVDKIMHFENRD